MAFNYSAGIDQSALAQLDDKQRRQVEAAFAKKAAGGVLGPGQKAAMQAYRALLGATTAPTTGGTGGTGASPVTAPLTGGSLAQVQAAYDASRAGKYGEDAARAGAAFWKSNPGMVDQVLQAAGIQGGSPEERLRNAFAALNLAGVQQYNENRTGNTSLAQNNPAFQNVTMATDENAMVLMMNDILSNPAKAREIWAERQSLVPSWAGNVYDSVAASGHTNPYGVGDVRWEYLADPSINLYDPTQPLFEYGAHPTSLQQLTGWQSGEEAFYRGLSAEEFAGSIMPAVLDYFHRPAGSAAPNAGLTFGVDPGLTSASPWDPGYAPAYWDHPIRSPKWQYALTEDPNAAGGNRFGIETPGFAAEAHGTGMEGLTPAQQLYARWALFGFPGDYTQNGTMNLTNVPFGRFGEFSPMTGTGSFSLGGSPQMNLMQQFLDGSIPPSWLGALENSGLSSWNAADYETLSQFNPAWGFAGPIGMAAALGRPDLFWEHVPWAAPFAESVSQEAYNRLLAVMQSVTGPPEEMV